MSNRPDTFLFVGQHQSTSDWSDVTGTSKFQRALGKPNLHGLKRARLERNYQAGDGEKLAQLQGPFLLDTLPDLPFHEQGMSGSGATDGVSTSALASALSDFYDFGLGSANDVTGEATHGSDAGTGTSAIADATLAETGTAVARLVPGTDSGKLSPRFQDGTTTTTAANDTMTMCRALTDDDGTADTPNESLTMIGGQVRQVLATGTDRTHLFLDAESPDQRDRYKGCAFATQSWAINPGQLLQTTFGGWMFTDADSNYTQTNPTYSAPTSGSVPKVWDSPVWIGSTQYMNKGATVTVTHTLSPNEAQGGPNGVYGYSVDDTEVTFSMQLSYGGLTHQAARSIVETLQGEATQDVLISAGRTAGAAMAWRIPAADVDAEVVIDGGKFAIQVTGRGTGTVLAQIAKF